MTGPSGVQADSAMGSPVENRKLAEYSPVCSKMTGKRPPIRVICAMYRLGECLNQNSTSVTIVDSACEQGAVTTPTFDVILPGLFACFIPNYLISRSDFRGRRVAYRNPLRHLSIGHSNT